MREELENAIKWAREVGAVQMKYFRSKNLKSETKLNDFDVVTEADKASEDIIINAIHTTYPTHSILSEESGASSGEDSDWLWVIDPLDGTTNFSQGLPIFNVSIGLRYKGETVAGVVYAPYLDELFYAEKGGGAWFNGEQIHCAHKSELSTMVVATGTPYDRDVNPDNNLENLARVCLRVRAMRFEGSAALDLSYTAAGIFDAYWELNIKPWDIEAGALILREAGGDLVSLREDRNVSVLAGSRETIGALRPLIV